MPQSKSRHSHKHPQSHNKTSNTHPGPKPNNRAIIVAVIFFAFFGLGISFFINASNMLVLIAGAVLGGLAGFLFGYQVKKSLSEK